jgi:hypothetical protein
MNKREVLQELIGLFFDFDDQYQGEKEYTVADFARYLTAGNSGQLSDYRDIAGGEEEWVRDNQDENTEIARLLVFNYRYAVIYFKKALRESNINTLDEFSFLIVLMTYPSLSKTELINKLIMEKPRV